jgi:hypothetical protein
MTASQNRIRTLLSLTAIVLSLAAAALAAEAEKASLVGKDLSTWRDKPGEWQIVGEVQQDPANPALLAVGAGVLYNGPKGRTVNIFSKLEHGDCEAHVEFMVPKGSNSGVYFQGRYEIQILDSWGVAKPTSGDCGGIYERWADADNRGYEGHAPRMNAARQPGQWQTFDVVFRGPRFDAAGKKTANARFVKDVHNGQVIHENVEVTGPTRAADFNDEKPLGPLMLQGDHGPVAFRNLWVKPLPAGK